MSSTTRIPRRLFVPKGLALATAVLACAAVSLHAQVASEDYTIVNTWLGQGNAGVNGGQALQNNSCVPTSTANGLSYLDAYIQSVGGPSPFTVSPNNYAAVNSLQTQMGTTVNGTTTSGQFNGLQSYFANVNPGAKITLGGEIAPAEPNSFYGTGLNAGINVQNANPTSQFLANALNAHDGVQLGIMWGTASNGNFSYSGGHEVSLTSINLNNGSGFINIVDPWGGGVGTNAGMSGAMVQLSVSTITLSNGLGSFLYVTYPTTIAGGPDPADTTSNNGFGADGSTGIIIDDTIEIAPEPEAYALLVIGLATLRGRSFLRRAKQFGTPKNAQSASASLVASRVISFARQRRGYPPA